MESAMESSNAQMFITPPYSLSQLPSELLLHILSFLDIPDLLALSRVSHLIRQLCLDPLLHSLRLLRASFTIERALPHRPPLTELMAHRIYITRTTFAARNLGRKLIKIKLNRQLLRRPSAEHLVELGVLPAECFRHGKGGGLAPGLVETKRKIEKERVKDLLRGWIEDWRKRGDESLRGREDEVKPDVRRIAKRFARDGSGNGMMRELPRWGKRVDVKEAPTRAKVLGLRRFWEKIGRDGMSAA